MRIGIFTETYTPYISGLVTSEVMLKKALEKLNNPEIIHFTKKEDIRDELNKIENVSVLLKGSRGMK